MLRYSPVNLTPVLRPIVSSRIGQLTPVHPQAPAGIPSWAVNLAIIGAGLGIGFAAFPYRKKAAGRVALDAGGGIAGIGVIFLILDLTGFRPI